MRSVGIVSVVGVVLSVAWFAFSGGGFPPSGETYVYSRSGVEIRFESEDGFFSEESVNTIRRIVQGEEFVSGNSGGYAGSCVVRMSSGNCRVAFGCQSFGREQGLREFSIGSEDVSLDELHVAFSTFFSAVDAEMAMLPARQWWDRLPERDRAAFRMSIA